METTPGTPHLLTDVRFSVSRKGYDPDEVDNFLERVSAAVAQLQDKLRQATAATEAAEARATDATRNESRLQARIAELESGRGAAPAAPAAPARTVDVKAEAEQAAALLVMAQRTADATLNDARNNAGEMVAEAEQEAARILGSARTQADEAIRDLDRTRHDLAADASALDSFLSEQRAVIGAGVSRIQAVLDDPAALRVATPPVNAAPPIEAAPAPTPAPAPEPEPAAIFEPVLADEPVVETIEPVSLFPASDEPVGPPTEAVKVFDAEDEFLADSDVDADAAMRRFFDADFEDDDRFGR
jgi:DivIVA domain-containing protein